MIARPILPLLGIGFLLAASVSGQHHMGGNDYDDGPGGGDPAPQGCSGVQAKVTITGTGLTFSPAAVTIDPGQPVCWTWSNTSAEHTIKADDGSFTSGPPADHGDFQRTFNTPGTYGYYCQVHGSLTGGMRGTIIVRGTGGTGGDGPGTLELAPTSYTVDEGIGSLTVTVLRTGGSDGAAAVKYTTANGSAKAPKDYTKRSGSLSWVAGDQEPKSIQVPVVNDSSKESDETFTVKLSKATGASLGASTATVTIHDDDGAGCGAALAAPTRLQARGQSESEIRLTWAGESAGAGEIRIERRQPGGAFQEIASVGAGIETFTDSGLPGDTLFQYRVKAVGTDGVPAISHIAAGATDGATTPCDDANALCLGGGRFEASVERPRSAGGGRTGRMLLPEAPNSGLFAVSPSADPQLLVNVIDGCNVNGHYWLYFAAVADAELTVKVRDTETGRTWVYFNPAGNVPAPVRDIEAFGACP